MKKIICESPEDLGRAVAKLFFELYQKEVKRKGFFTAVLSGGSTPEVLFRVLAAEFRNNVTWDRVHFFWGDERCVPPESPESNFNAADKILFSKIDLPAGNIHRIKGELDPGEAARAYEGELIGFFGAKAGWETPSFDLVFLGIGEDGHTLSLFPGSKALDERQRLVVENYVEKLGAWRVTMTLRLVNNASSVVFMVSGEKKASVLREVLDGGIERYPAQMIRPVKGELYLFADRPSAGRLLET
jgi:6-phosphogluconolactonase